MPESHAQQRNRLQEAFEALSDQERKGRLLILPDYEHKRDEILQPERIVAQFQYFWDHWVPLLGPGPSLVYMKLRQYTYYNRQTGELREELSNAFPKQEEIARSLGMERKALMRHLKTLEQHGLLLRKGRTRFSRTHGQQVRTTDVYRLKIVDILIPQHQVDVLLDDVLGSKDPSANRWRNQPVAEKSQNGTFHGVDPIRPVEKPSEMSQIGTFLSSPETGQLSSVPVSRPINVDQRLQNASRDQRPRRPGLSQDPRVQELTPRERERKDSLAAEIGDVLKTMARDHSTAEHKSAGFHRLVAYLLPEEVVREALRITRDAVDDDHAGTKGLGNPSAYFGGIVRNKAKELGVDLRITSERERQEEILD